MCADPPEPRGVGRLLAIVMSSAASLWRLFRDQIERGSGINLKLFGFNPESVFAIFLESRSGSSWNSVRNHPGSAFTLDRIPHHDRVSRVKEPGVYAVMFSALLSKEELNRLKHEGRTPESGGQKELDPRWEATTFVQVK
jgi:hypothetical protein